MIGATRTRYAPEDHERGEPVGEVEDEVDHHRHQFGEGMRQRVLFCVILCVDRVYVKLRRHMDPILIREEIQ